MMQMKYIVRVAAVGLSVWFGGAAMGQAAFNEGQKIEAREGDTWSAATIVKKEGRRYLIHYEGADAATDEWVTIDRLRAVGAAAGGTTPKPVVEPGTPADPKPAPAPVVWMTGQKVQVKWGGLWRDASIVNRRDAWHLVEYEPGRMREWVEPYRIRKVGSNVDEVGYCKPNGSVRNNEGPPAAKPGEPPRPHGWTPEKEQAAVEEANDPAFKEVDASSAPLLQLESAGPAWKLVPDAPEAAARQLALRSIALKGIGTEAFDGVKTLVIPRAKATWAYACHIGGMASRGTNVRLERIDLASGASAAVWPVTSNTFLLDVSPDGKTALFRTDGFGAGKSDKVELWSLEGTTPTKKLAFKPFGGDWTTADIKGGLFADATRILLWNGKGTLTMWDTATAKPVYSCQMNPGCAPSLSATGKYLAINSGQRALVLSTATGQVLAEKPMQTSSGAVFGFSPMGTQLVAWADRSVRVWDLASGFQVSEFSTPGNIGGTSIDIVADGYALLGGMYLLDFERRVVLWHYQSSSRNAGTVAPGGQYVYAYRDPFGKTGSLAMAKLPHPDALRAAESIKPDEVLLVKPGVKVSLSVDVPGTAEERSQITEALTLAIKETGLVLADNQPIVFRAFVEQGKSEEREYRSFGRVEKVTVTPQHCRLRIEADGTPAWESQTVSNAGFILHMKQGQTIQDAVAEATKPNTAFLKTVRVPRYLAKPKDPAWFGSSTLTAQGVGAAGR